MFSDIRGFTSYTAKKGDQAAYKLSRVHDALLREQVEEKNGIVVKTLGDGIMAAFAELTPAVHAAVAIHRAIRKRNQEQRKELIDIGIGLANGAPIMTDADLIGHSVNLSQRICSMAKGGQILVTEKFAHETNPPHGCHFVSLGRRGLKGLDDVSLYELQWMEELARLSDRDDMFTLILTQRGTLAVKLAKNIQAHVDNAVVQLGTIADNEDFSSRLQKAVAKFTQAIISKSLPAAGIEREQPLDDVDLLVNGDEVVLTIGKKPIRLHGVDSTKAEQFRDKMMEMRNKLRLKQTD
jgi:class 3 adenylate cyclase